MDLISAVIAIFIFLFMLLVDYRLSRISKNMDRLVKIAEDQHRP